MKNNKVQELVDRIVAKLDELVPVYSQNPADAFSNGNVSVCLIDEDGNFYGKIWGENKARGRQSYTIACKKASQVWITGLKTGEFEKKVFNGEIDEHPLGIQRPDFIGWEGGQPIEVDGLKLSVGFSGFRGFRDVEIVEQAIL